MKRRKFAEEGGAVARSTMFPNLGDAGIGRPSTGRLSTAHLDHLTDRELYDRAGQALRRLDSLLGPDETCKTPSKTTDEIMADAQERVASAEATLLEKEYANIGAFSHSLDGRESPLGVIRKVQVQGRPAFNNAFNLEFWSRPQGGDLTLKDDLLILDPSLREMNLGRLNVEPEE